MQAMCCGYGAMFCSLRDKIRPPLSEFSASSLAEFILLDRWKEALWELKVPQARTHVLRHSDVCNSHVFNWQLYIVHVLSGSLPWCSQFVRCGSSRCRNQRLSAERTYCWRLEKSQVSISQRFTWVCITLLPFFSWVNLFSKLFFQILIIV